MCLNKRGRVTKLHLLLSSGCAAYDARMRREMSRWCYHPFAVNGSHAAVCTSVTFIYRQVP